MNLQEITKKVEDVARKAGAFIREESKNFNLNKVEQKGFYE